MTFWTILVLLCLLAVVFAAWPLYRKSHRLTPLVATVIVFVVALSAIMYDQIGSPGVPSGHSSAAAGTNGDLPGMGEVIVSLRERLKANPEDVAGWKMLGRTQMALQDFAGAADAYERAMAIEEGKDAQTMVDLAVAILNRDGTPIEGRPASLLDSALALDPNNPAALFYTGLAAANRGDTDTATERWQILLGLNPPENIRGILEQRLAEWRGEAMPAAQPAMPQPVAGDTAVPDDAVISANVSLSEAAKAAIKADVTVFVIARDPSAPSPPIAVSRHRVSELPAMISLTDAQSMVAGRDLSKFAEIELLARASLSGGPAAQSGDWFGSMLVRPAENNSVSLTIDQQVP
jgi:cytochrome c-type biogenesis protein CcmH